MAFLSGLPATKWFAGLTSHCCPRNGLIKGSVRTETLLRLPASNSITEGEQSLCFKNSRSVSLDVRILPSLVGVRLSEMMAMLEFLPKDAGS